MYGRNGSQLNKKIPVFSDGEKNGWAAPLQDGAGLRPLPRGWWSGRRRGLLTRDRTDGLPGQFHDPVAWLTALPETSSASLTVAGPRRLLTGLPSAPPSFVCRRYGYGPRARWARPALPIQT